MKPIMSVLRNGLTISHFADERCLIAYKGKVIYDGQLGRLFKHFYIVWNDFESMWECSRFCIYGETIQDCINDCLLDINNCEDTIFYTHKKLLELFKYELPTNDDIAMIKNGTFQNFWEDINYCARGVEDFFLTNYYEKIFIFEEDNRSVVL